MSAKQRGQNVRVGDTVRLKLFVYNGSAPSNVDSVEKVEIYRLYATDVTTENPYGKLLVETIDAEDVEQGEDGEYYVDVELSSPLYTVDRYSDEWYLVFDPTLPTAISEQLFNIYPNAWFTDSRPVVHDFDFAFSPDKIVTGSKRYIEIEIMPNVPRNSDKLKYYQNLVSAGDLYISIEQTCGECVPAEEDLRLVADEELVTEREFCRGYYYLNTTDLDCGIYHVWFRLDLGDNTYISDKQPLQIYH